MSKFLTSGKVPDSGAREAGQALTTDVIVWGMPLRFWTRFALVWLMFITVTGAAVRLTGSGLGCTDWPTCSVNTELEAPGFHSAIEFGNRMISGLAIIPVIAAWIGSRRGRPDLKAVIYATVFGFIGQVLLGMLVTRTELDPRVVIGHFLLSIVLIWLGVVMDYRARNPRPASAGLHAPSVDELKRRLLSRAMFGAATAVIVVGTFVTGSGPHTGSEASGEPIPRLGFDIREISRIHSLLGWVLVVLIVIGMWKARSANAQHQWSVLDQMWFGRIGTLALIQGGIGYLQYAIGVPVGLVALHIAGSVLLWTAVTWYAMVAADPLTDSDQSTRTSELVS